jgi:hypothetical protein
VMEKCGSYVIHTLPGTEPSKNRAGRTTHRSHDLLTDISSFMYITCPRACGSFETCPIPPAVRGDFALICFRPSVRPSVGPSASRRPPSDRRL